MGRIQLAAVCSAALILVAAFGPPMRPGAHREPTKAEIAVFDQCAQTPTPRCLLQALSWRAETFEASASRTVRETLVVLAWRLPDRELALAIAKSLQVNEPERLAPPAPSFPMAPPLPADEARWRAEVLMDVAEHGLAAVIAKHRAQFEIARSDASALAKSARDILWALDVAPRAEQPLAARALLESAKPYTIYSDAMVRAAMEWATETCTRDIFDAAVAIDPARYENATASMQRVRLTGNADEVIFALVYDPSTPGPGAVSDMADALGEFVQSGVCVAPN